MHVRHERLFLWLKDTFPPGRLYGAAGTGPARPPVGWLGGGSWNETGPPVASHLPELECRRIGTSSGKSERYVLSVAGRQTIE